MVSDAWDFATVIRCMLYRRDGTQKQRGVRSREKVLRREGLFILSCVVTGVSSCIPSIPSRSPGLSGPPLSSAIAVGIVLADHAMMHEKY